MQSAQSPGKSVPRRAAGLSDGSIHRVAACAAVLVLASVSVSLAYAQAGQLATPGAPVWSVSGDYELHRIGQVIEVFEDATGERTIEDVAGGASGVEFKPATQEAPGFGMTRSAAWVRFTVVNEQAAPVVWMLEYAYPHVDFIDLYVPRADGGFEHRVAGDRHAFGSREVEYRNVVFRLTEPASTTGDRAQPNTRTYYLRAKTQGSLIVPLVAWTPPRFMAHLNAELPALWMFYGVMIAIALYNLFILLSVRNAAYLYYVTYTLSYALVQFVLNGLAFQYLWPTSIEWANRCLPIAIGLGFVTGIQFQRYFLELKHHLPKLDRVMQIGVGITFAATLSAGFLPYEISLRLTVGLGTVMIVLTMAAGVRMLLRGSRAAKFYMTAWGVFLVGILLYLLKTIGVMPSNFFTEFTTQIGASLEAILLSLGLADRINVMRADLQRLNGKLNQNVVELEVALDRAEEARRAKSEFLASVSHELRTPLNSIINIPEGLREEFAVASTASCTKCGSRFVLDAGETIGTDTACPECAAPGPLSQTEQHVYQGRPERSIEYLDQVVRSGKHLLEVINDILDVSRLEAGQMRVEMAEVDVAALIEARLAPMTGLAERQGVKLRIERLPVPCVVWGDSVKLGQVLINLVGNAIKFSDGRGTVTLTVTAEPDAYLFSVVDKGIGISEADCARVFERFVQAEGGGTRRFGGSGLGLAITKDLVELHHGRIWVESKLGHGSTFRVRLPTVASFHEVVASQPQRPSQPESPTPSSAGVGA